MKKWTETRENRTLGGEEGARVISKSAREGKVVKKSIKLEDRKKKREEV